MCYASLPGIAEIY